MPPRSTPASAPAARALPPGGGDGDDPFRARWAALHSLQAAHKSIGERRSDFDRAEEATLAGVERLHARKRRVQEAAAKEPPSPVSPASLPPLPPPRLPNTLEASAVRIRWLALLFGFNETRRGLEELAASVEALRAACEAAVGVEGGGGNLVKT